MFKAVERGVTVGITLWYLHGEVGYYHLGAWNARGYELNVSFALFMHVIDTFAGNLRWLTLGGSAGVGSASPTDGLARFKRGWASDTRLTYLCGIVLNRGRYDMLVRARGGGQTNYFPAYRHDEAQ
jgi:hypothetical protein